MNTPSLKSDPGPVTEEHLSKIHEMLLVARQMADALRLLGEDLGGISMERPIDRQIISGATGVIDALAEKVVAAERAFGGLYEHV